LVDSDLTKIIGNAKTQTRRIVDDLVLQAEKQAKKASDAEKLERFADLIIENARLKSQGDKQFDTLMQNNKELLQINDKLRKENRKLRNLIDEAAVEIDKARTVAKV
jgi:hypothetical protein